VTWIWATLLLLLSAPFVLWPLLRAVPPAAEENEGEEGGADPPAAGG
jgi:hypothetical protein